MERVKPEKQSLGQTDWGYINARIRGMKAELLSKESLEALLNQPDVNGIRQQLQSTPYAPYIKEAEAKYQIGMSQMQVVGRAVRENMVGTIDRIRNLLAGRPAELLDYLLGHWDVYNVKTILRGKKSGYHPSMIIQYLFPLGTLSLEFLEGLSHCSGMREIVAGLVKEDINQSLEKGLESLASTGNLLELELALDKWYFNRCLKKAAATRNNDYKLLQKLIEKEIDLTNAMMIIRLAGSRVEDSQIGQFYLDGGREIDRELFVELSGNRDLEEVLHKLSALKTCLSIREKLSLYKRLFDVSIFERAMWGEILRFASGLMRSDLFGVGIMIGYVERKYNEMINLRIILRCKEFGMPEEIVRGELIYV